jgi:hypothetical protein
MVEPKNVWLKKVILLLKIKIWQSHGAKPIQVRVVKSLTRAMSPTGLRMLNSPRHKYVFFR